MQLFFSSFARLEIGMLYFLFLISNLLPVKPSHLVTLILFFFFFNFHLSLQKWYLLIQYYKLEVTLRSMGLIWIHKTTTNIFYIHIIEKNGTTTGFMVQHKNRDIDNGQRCHENIHET